MELKEISETEFGKWTSTRQRYQYGDAKKQIEKFMEENSGKCFLVSDVVKAIYKETKETYGHAMSDKKATDTIKMQLQYLVVGKTKKLGYKNGKLVVEVPKLVEE